LDFQDEFFVKNRLDVKENDEHALEFAFHMFLPFFGLGEIGLSV
jgi:hypothetical protein